MTAFRNIAERFRALFRREELDAELDEELQYHLDRLTEKNLQAGMEPREARRQALIAFGGVERFREKTREERGIRFLDALLQDIRQALRQFRRNPGFALTAMLTLALGIGATSLVFSVFSAVVLRPLPFPDPQELVRIREVTPQGQRMSVSDPNFLDFREQASSFQEMVAVSVRPLVLQVDEEPVRVRGMATTLGLFPMMGVSPVLGRGFQAAHFQTRGEAEAVMIGHDLWQRQFGGDSDLVGTTVVLDGVTREVVGVLPRTLDRPFDFDVWLPFSADPGFPRDDHRREVFARLASGVSLEAAQAELGEIQARLGEQYPESNGGFGVAVYPFREWIVGPQATRMAQVLLSAVGLLLLLACASVSNLLVARATSRQREMSLRAALGAGRKRLLSQLLAESLTLSIVGGALGLLLTYWAMPVIRALPASPLPRLEEAQVDGMVLVFAMGASLLSALVFGIAPALHGTRLDLMGALKTGGRVITLSTRRLRDGLVVGQLALATMLLVGAGLMAFSFLRMAGVDPGFDPDRTLLVEISVPLDRYPEMSPRTGTVYAEILRVVEAVPGVAAAGATMASPINQARPSNFVARPEESALQEDFLQVDFRPVTPGFFDAMRIPLRAGRIFTDQEAQAVVEAAGSGEGNRPPVVLARALARRLWPQGDGVGESIVWGGPGGPEMVVVGVVGDVRDLSFPGDPEPMVYLPHRLLAWPTMTLIVRSEADPASVAGPVREAVWSVDPGIPVPEFQLVEQSLDSALAGSRLSTVLVGLFSLSALLLAGVGLYGLTAFSVARRQREIGVRIALGAPRPAVFSLVLRKGLALALVGMGLGMAGALLLGRYLESILFQVEPSNVATYALVAGVLGSVTLLATLVPARRATRVDPVHALQAE